jgi:hypothetical protein
MRRKVSSDWLPSFIKATQPVLEILNMAGFFWDRPRNAIRHVQSFVLLHQDFPKYMCSVQYGGYL